MSRFVTFVENIGRRRASLVDDNAAIFARLNKARNAIEQTDSNRGPFSKKFSSKFRGGGFVTQIANSGPFSKKFSSKFRGGGYVTQIDDFLDIDFLNIDFN